MALKKGIVGIVSGILFEGKGPNRKGFLKLRDALTAEARCGFGFDYCRGVLRMEDKATDEDFVIYIKNGELTRKPLEDFDNNGA